MTTFRLIRLFPVLLVSTFAIACGSGSSPTRQVPVGPTAPSPRRPVPVWLRDADGSRAGLARERRPVGHASPDAHGAERHVVQPERHSHLRVPGIGSHRFFARRIAHHVVPRRRQPDGRARRRRPHVVYGAVGSPTDDADVLARAGGPGNHEFRLDIAGDVPHEAGRLQPAQRAV